MPHARLTQFLREFLPGLADEAAKNQDDLQASIAPADGDTEQQLYLRWMYQSNLDGFVLNRARQSDGCIRYLSEEHIPFASLERSIDPLDYPSILVDNIESVSSQLRASVTPPLKEI